MSDLRATPSRPPWHLTPEPATGDLRGAIIWAGSTWAVTSYGIEARDGRYAISAENLMRLDSSFGWIQHMAAKGRVDMPDFIAALGVAHLFHGGRNREAADIFAAFCTRHQVNGFTRPKGKPGST